MYPWLRTMYAVVQMGSTIFRSECITTRSVVSARAGWVTPKAQTSDSTMATMTSRRGHIMGILLGGPAAALLGGCAP